MRYSLLFKLWWMEVHPRHCTFKQREYAAIRTEPIDVCKGKASEACPASFGSGGLRNAAQQLWGAGGLGCTQPLPFCIAGLNPLGWEATENCYLCLASSLKHLGRLSLVSNHESWALGVIHVHCLMPGQWLCTSKTLGDGVFYWQVALFFTG